MLGTKGTGLVFRLDVLVSGRDRERLVRFEYETKTGASLAQASKVLIETNRGQQQSVDLIVNRDRDLQVVPRLSVLIVLLTVLGDYRRKKDSAESKRDEKPRERCHTNVTLI